MDWLRRRTVELIVIASALAGNAEAATITATEQTSIAEPRPANLPSDADLVARGAVIAAVEFDIRQIFDRNDPRENAGLYRLANDLHIRTKRATIRAQILFAAGDRYDPRKLAETERNLRALHYIYDARVVPVRYADGKVTVRVITKDVWTLSPGISFGRSGGTNNTRFDLEDSNLFGWGKKVEISHGSNVDRTSTSISYIDPNVLGSRWALSTEYADASDGVQRAASLSQPFYSLDTPWTVTAKALQYDRNVSRYNLGSIVDQFQRNEDYYELSGGISSGLINGWARRLYAGFRYDRNLFATAPGFATPVVGLPTQRILSFPFVGLEVVQDDYRKVGDQNQIGRTEDLYFGTQASIEIGYSNPSFGADRNALMLVAAARKGFQLTPLTQLFLTSNASTRLEAGAVENLFVDGTATYYWRWRPDRVLYLFVDGTTTRRLDPDSQLLIGGDSGLRGYPLRYESGTSRGLFTVEQRFYTNWYPFRLARFGAAIFADVGRTWGRGVIGNSDPGTLSDVGVGMRFGNTRSGLGNVLHVDLAFPLKGDGNINKLQFLVGTKSSF